MHPGETLSSRYRVDQILSIRGTRQRCLARKISDNSRVIIETLHDNLATDPSALKSFRYEIELSLTLNGPYFISAIDSFTESGKLYVVWNYVDASPLTRNQSLAHLSTFELLEFISRMVRAIEYAHTQGVIHGALSTDAILVTPELEPVITEFSAHENEPITDPGVQGGISSYRCCAPELFNGEAIDPSCDFYSLGVISQFLINNQQRTQIASDSSKHRITPVQRSDLHQFSHAIGLINGLTSDHREIRMDRAQRILDDSFLDSMATPPQGNDIVYVDRSRSRAIKRFHVTPQTFTDQSARMRRILWRLVIGVGVIAIVFGVVKIFT